MKKNIGEARLHQTQFILMEIAKIAETIQRLMVDSVVSGDARTREANSNAAQTLASTIGYLSDLGQEKIGGIGDRDGADDWILSPMYSTWKEREGTVEANLS